MVESTKKCFGGTCKKKRHPNPNGWMLGLSKVLQRIAKAKKSGYGEGYIKGLEAKADRLRRHEK